MEVKRDEIGLRKAKEHGWKFLYLAPDSCAIVSGSAWFERNITIGGLRPITLEDYLWFTDEKRSDKNNVTVAEWYNSIQLSDILKVANINC